MPPPARRPSSATRRRPSSVCACATGPWGSFSRNCKNANASVLAAFWGRSGGALGRARSCQPLVLAFRPGRLALRLPRSLPPGCRCDDLAPSRPASPASQPARRPSQTNQTSRVPQVRRSLMLNNHSKLELWENGAAPSAQLNHKNVNVNRASRESAANFRWRRRPP